MDKARVILASAAATGAVGILLLLVADPTHGDMRRLDTVAQTAKSGPRLASLAQTNSYAQDVDTLVQAPIFTMSVGAGAYTERTFRLFGVAISPNRRAALVSIDGANPVWLRAGELSGDVELIDVDAGHARFDTPLGVRTIGINDPAPAAPTAAGG